LSICRVNGREFHQLRILSAVRDYWRHDVRQHGCDRRAGDQAPPFAGQNNPLQLLLPWMAPTTFPRPREFSAGRPPAGISAGISGDQFGLLYGIWTRRRRQSSISSPKSGTNDCTGASTSISGTIRSNAINLAAGKRGTRPAAKPIRRGDWRAYSEG